MGVKMRRRKRKRRNTRRLNDPSRVILLELVFPSCSPMGCTLKERSRSIKTSSLLSYIHHCSIFIWLIRCFGSNHYRMTSEEKRYIERQIDQNPESTYNSIRRAAEVHRQVRDHARRWIRPGMTMTDIANGIEDGSRALVEENGMESGIGFPTGLSLNDCAAHYTPNAGDKTGAYVRMSLGWFR